MEIPKFFNKSLLNPRDRKNIKFVNTTSQEDKMVYYIYLSLITKDGIEKLLQFVKSNNGDMRIYPYKELTCIELRVNKPIK